MTPETYDSRPDTIAHILRVRELLYIVQNKLESRGFAHDLSKLEEPEKSTFDLMTPRLKGLAYGSEEYRSCLREMKPAIAHHHAHNSHHPEYYRKQVCNICFAEYPSDHDGQCAQCGNGQFTDEANVAGMTLLDVIEMLCDWKAASERHADGEIMKSIAISRDRFKLAPQLAAILENTAKEMGWVQP